MEIYFPLKIIKTNKMSKSFIACGWVPQKKSNFITESFLKVINNQIYGINYFKSKFKS